MLAQKDKKKAVLPNSETVASLAEKWLSAKMDIAEKTRATYTERLNYSILPYLGAMKVQDLSTPEIQSWVAALNRKGSAPRTIRYAYTVRSQMLSLAVRYKLIPANPCEGVILPRQVERQKRVLKPEEIKTFLDYHREHGSRL